MYPCALVVLSGVTYMVDGKRWIKIPTGLSFEDTRKMHKEMYPSVYEHRELELKYETHLVQSKTQRTKDGFVEYRVKVWTNGHVDCNCPGFTFRKRCKHTEMFSHKKGR